MQTPKVTETVRLSAHRRPPVLPMRPVLPAASTGGGPRHGSPLSAQ
jgi:hypothetical protein